jgi:hypothetical protein
MNEDQHDESVEPIELIPASEKFMAALDVGLLVSAILLAIVGWRRKVHRKKSRSAPIPEP